MKTEINHILNAIEHYTQTHPRFYKEGVDTSELRGELQTDLKNFFLNKVNASKEKQCA